MGPAARQLAVIDFERAEPGLAVRDLVPGTSAPICGAASSAATAGRDTRRERALPCLATLDALSELQWGTLNGDREVTGRARRTFARLAGGT